MQSCVMIRIMLGRATVKAERSERNHDELLVPSINRHSSLSSAVARPRRSRSRSALLARLQLITLFRVRLKTAGDRRRPQETPQVEP